MKAPPRPLTIVSVFVNHHHTGNVVFVDAKGPRGQHHEYNVTFNRSGTQITYLSRTKPLPVFASAKAEDFPQEVVAAAVRAQARTVLH